MSIVGECYVLTNLVAEYKEANKKGKDFLTLRKIKQMNRLCEKHVSLNTVLHLSETISKLLIENQKLRKKLGDL